MPALQERTDKGLKPLQEYIEWVMQARRKLALWEKSTPPRDDAPVSDADLKDRQRRAVVEGADPALVIKFTMKAPDALVEISAERRLLKSLGFTQDEDGIALSQAAAARPNRDTDAKPFGGDPNKEYIASVLAFRRAVSEGVSIRGTELRSLRKQAQRSGCDPMLLNNFELDVPQSFAGKNAERDLLLRFGYRRGKDGAR